jgi:hypothetical protein
MARRSLDWPAATRYMTL